MFRTLAASLVFAAAFQMAMAHPANASEPQSLLDQMQQATARLSGYSVLQVKRERFGERLLPPESLSVKYQSGRVYLHILSGPRKGAEAIYVPGWNGNKVRIHKGSFPDVTLNLDPHGNLLMDDQHHPIEHAGFDHLVGTLMNNVQRARQAGEGTMRLLPATTVGGRAADVVEMTTPWRTTPTTVPPGEDLWSLSRRLRVDPYGVLHENELHRAGQVKGGATLRIPTYYGTRTVLAIDQQTHLPSRLEVYDGKGRLYEFYEWTALDARGALSSADFDPKNPSYRF